MEFLPEIKTDLFEYGGSLTSSHVGLQKRALSQTVHARS